MPENQELYQEVLEAQPIPFDVLQAAIRLRGIDPASLPAPAQEAPEYKLGDVRKFWVHNNDTFEYSQIDARLVHVSDHAWFWLDTGVEPTKEDGTAVTEADWQAAGESFDSSYQAVRAVFGFEESPGLDGDPRLYILHSDELGEVGGYFGDDDSFPSLVDEHSNQGQYFYISTSGAGDIAGDYYKLTLAHEFQHMIQSGIDRNEDGWLNEGFSVLAQQIAGMRGDIAVGAYLTNLDQSLWYWGGESSDYGHSYLYMEYLYEQLGVDFIKKLAANKANGLIGVDAVLQEIGSARTADDFYADYMMALAMNDPSLGDGAYAFREIQLPFAVLTNNLHLSRLPATYASDANQYGGIDILRFEGRGKVKLTFDGARAAKLIPTEAHSGKRMWWSNRADGSMVALTRRVDLSAVEQATLRYWSWYDLEEEWDYGYVLVSQDGGNNWSVLRASASRDTNPNGNNYGNGFTGRSGGGKTPAWVQETIDLNAYAGKVIWLRFAAITDTVLNQPGLAIDDIEIPEIGFSDDAESDAAGWSADGFVRMHNRVPQLWRVYVALTDKNDRVALQELSLQDANGVLEINFQETPSIMIFITALTRQTSEKAPYRLIFTRP
ncbi:MAG: immune inhibitor A [Anaerolineales bacterium]|nr:immune inhibitor A [Anaerolineales bacterium]